VLNRWNPGSLPRGDRVKGYILAEGTDFLANTRSELLDAQVCCDDGMGKEMVFPIKLVNRPWHR
jgi:hypothetical protein